MVYRMRVRRKRDDFLMHFGVQGQKWGLRRWQNKDGSLTPDGYVHYGYAKSKKIKRINGSHFTKYDITNKGIDQFLDKDGNLTDAGRKSLNKNNLTIEATELDRSESTREKQKKDAGVFKRGDDEYIKKDSVMYRLARGDETLDEKRKYMYMTKNDKITYDSNSEFFDDGTLHKDTYVANKDLKVATYEKTFNYIFNEVKDLKVKDLDWNEKNIYKR